MKFSSGSRELPTLCFSPSLVKEAKEYYKLNFQFKMSQLNILSKDIIQRFSFSGVSLSRLNYCFDPSQVHCEIEKYDFFLRVKHSTHSR